MAQSIPSWQQFIAPAELGDLLQRARREDVGPNRRDLTSELFIDATAVGRAAIVSRAAGRLAGAALLEEVVRTFDPAVAITPGAVDGDALQPGALVAQLNGPLRAILMLERTALNLLCHLSGIASLTAQYVHAVRGSSAKIYDTRKTIPGWRGLAKYAVRCGGGYNHRMGLYDAVLLKDNHLASLPTGTLQAKLTEAVRRARQAKPAPSFIEIEVDTLEQLPAALAADPDLILLDNMPPEQLRRAVGLRQAHAGAGRLIELEASGGVNLDTVRAIAHAGVDRIAIGALTHSAPALDLGLDLLP